MSHMLRRAITVVVGILGCLTANLIVVDAATALPVSATRILITGDSITQGSSGDYTWRRWLWRKLQGTTFPSVDFVGPKTSLFDNVSGSGENSNYLDPSFDQNHYAIWGDTLRQEVDNVGGLVASTNPDVMVVMLGSNDLAFWTGPADTVALTRQYIANARAAHPGLDVVVGQILTRWDPWAQSYVMQAQASEYASLLADMAGSMSTADERVVVAPTLAGWDPRTQTWDGTHPGPSGESVIAQRVSQGLSALGIGNYDPDISGAQPWPMPGPIPGVEVRTEAATLRWDRHSTGSTGMFIQMRLVDQNQAWQELPYPVTDEWTLDPLAGGATYDFRVRPTKGFIEGVSGPTNERLIPGITPGAPSDVNATRATNDSDGRPRIAVSWNSGVNATGYMLSQLRMPGSSSDYEFLPYPVLGGSWVFGWLSSGYRYRFRVQAVRGLLSSAWASSNVERSTGYPSGYSYAVLGDSYAAGNGMSMDPGDYQDTQCYRHYGSWSSHVAKFYVIDRQIIACSGAVISDIYPGQADTSSAFFAQNPRRAQLITVTVGGNDVGFRNLLIRCQIGNCGDTATFDEYAPKIYNTGTRLDALYDLLRTRFPAADIAAVGYPSPLGTLQGAPPICNSISPSESNQADLFTLMLNREIRDAAAAAHVWVGDANALHDAFYGHGACDYLNWIHTYSAPFPNSFHPNEVGHFQAGVAVNALLNASVPSGP